MSSSPAVELRVATEADAAAVAALAGQLGYPVTAEVMAQRLRQLPHDGEIVVAAIVAGQVIGWMQLGVARSLESPPFVEIRGLVVDADHREQGIGARLLAFASQWTAAQAVPILRVRSNVLRTGTHAFYEKHGFSLIKAQKVFSLDLDQSFETP